MSTKQEQRLGRKEQHAQEYVTRVKTHSLPEVLQAIQKGRGWAEVGRWEQVGTSFLPQVMGAKESHFSPQSDKGPAQAGLLDGPVWQGYRRGTEQGGPRGRETL